MKMENFNVSVFLATIILFGLLLIPSLMFAFVLDEGTLNPEDTFGNFFANLFNILRFPTHTLFFSIIDLGGPLTFLGGLFVNSLFFGLAFERIISCFVKKKHNIKTNENSNGTEK